MTTSSKNISYTNDIIMCDVVNANLIIHLLDAYSFTDVDNEAIKRKNFFV